MAINKEMDLAVNVHWNIDKEAKRARESIKKMSEDGKKDVKDLSSSFKGLGNVAIGNVIGSNLYNSVLVLGCATSINSAPITHTELFRDILLMVLLSIMIFPISWSQKRVTRPEGLLLLIVYLLFITSLIHSPHWAIF